MSAYLKRLQIDSVEESAEHPSAYLKRVEVVEVVDSDGNPWEPVPGPDPWDELAVVDKALWHESNVYEEGQTLTATTATYIGGNPDVTTYKWRFQTRAKAEDSWVNGTWTNYNNTLQQVEWVNVQGGQIRFQCQARDNTDPDNVDQLNSFSPTKTVAYPTVVVSATTVSGDPYVGSTITCAQPAVTGGDGNYTYSYMWLDSNSVKSSSNTTTAGSYDVGKVMNCYVTVTSGDGQTGTTQTTNGVGPIEYYTIGNIQLENSNTSTIIENGDIDTIIQGASVTYVADYDGNLPENHALWTWTVRSGGATIRGSSNLPYCTFELPTEFPGGCSLSVAIQGKAGENYTDDNSTLLWNIVYTE